MIDLSKSPEIAIIIPCHNEAETIGSVIKKFRAILPQGHIYVYDNNSSDQTLQAAVEQGVHVRHEKRQGKGYVVNRMFADVEADVYVMIDGDDTYDITDIDLMIRKLIHENCDMIVGVRKPVNSSCYRAGHTFGNFFFNSIVSAMFGRRVNDMLSGFRVFSRRFVKTFPYLVCGFEIETALTVHALELRAPFGEHDVKYKPRVEGSHSKLNTYRDGIKILVAVINLFREEKPLTFFGLIAASLFLASILSGLPDVNKYLVDGTHPGDFMAMYSVLTLLLAMLFSVAGVILQSVKRGRQEVKRLFYLGRQ